MSSVRWGTRWPCSATAVTFLDRVLADRPDFVFNIAEGLGVGRCREARVPAVLELLDIPFSGSDPLTMAATLDKAVARTLVKTSGVAVPEGTVIAPGAERAALISSYERLSPGGDGRLLIVKPSAEGSSKGIRENRSLVDDLDDFIHGRLFRFTRTIPSRHWSRSTSPVMS